jgi:hypothetical protein
VHDCGAAAELSSRHYSSSCISGDSKLHPYVSLREEYSDNLNLTMEVSNRENQSSVDIASHAENRGMLKITETY